MVYSDLNAPLDLGEARREARKVRGFYLAMSYRVGRYVCPLVLIVRINY